MTKSAIKVENISKQYQLGSVGTGTLSHDLNRFWAKFRGKEDPYLQVGEINDRTISGNSTHAWALKDINFEVNQGDVLGIIGKNGAGKSTLLKILSQITSPTSGKISMNGRVAALLEVGTGFHNELTGRENIYLNGAILGMRNWEIKKKFDEIVDFSGVQKYIDTPVKRYSSGMKVRLGFAVAAHLEPEILIVDEVLAVGDAEFQKKCLGKMESVSKTEGRTILFVSHNMSAISNLCPRSILMKNGQIEAIDSSVKIINQYISNNKLSKSFNGKGVIEEILMDKIEYHCSEDIKFKIKLREIPKHSILNIICLSVDGTVVFFHRSSDTNTVLQKNINGMFESHNLLPGEYVLRFTISRPIVGTIDSTLESISIRVVDSANLYGSRKGIFTQKVSYE